MAESVVAGRRIVRSGLGHEGAQRCATYFNRQSPPEHHVHAVAVSREVRTRAGLLLRRALHPPTPAFDQSRSVKPRASGTLPVNIMIPSMSVQILANPHVSQTAAICAIPIPV